MGEGVAVGGDVGEFEPLQKYLRGRYADRVVLTFSQIEDLLGFPLPGPARLEPEWWAGAAASAPSAQSESWTVAGRTATVNMSAQTVVFERDPTPNARNG